ncbi:hypothetical protein GQ607_014869, partial [Colletotrichum asianum]
MAVIEEFVVIGIYLALGFFLVRNEYPATGEIANRAWKSRAADSVEPQRIQQWMAKKPSKIDTIHTTAAATTAIACAGFAYHLYTATEVNLQIDRKI